MITLINCKVKLEALGIYMEQRGSGDLFSEQLSQVLNYLSWEYDFSSDTILIWVEDGTEIPDLSMFGEVGSYEPSAW